MSDISSLPAVQAAQSEALMGEIAIALASKRLDAARLQGAAVAELLASAAQAGKAPDRGDQLDLSA